MEIWNALKQPPEKKNKGWENIIQKPLHTRWLDKVGEENSNGCWPWLGSRTVHGYGKIRDNYKSVGAHRISYRLNIGKIPRKLHVLHKCDNPLCVNPDHLFLGTQSDNNKDMFKKNRDKNQYNYNKDFINGRSRPVEAFIDNKWVLFQSISEASKTTGALSSKISIASRQLRKKAGGLKWRSIQT